MKKWKKLVALALAAILAMSLLTACGGGGGSQSFETQVENAVFAAYSQAIGRNNIKSNDPALKQLANKSLSCVKNGRYNVNDMKKSIEVKANAGNPNELTVQIAMPLGDPNGYTTENSYRVLAITPEMVGELKNELKDMDGELDEIVVDLEEQGARIDGIGVAAKTIDGKTYAAVGFSITGDSALFEKLS